MSAHACQEILRAQVTSLDLPFLPCLSVCIAKLLPLAVEYVQNVRGDSEGGRMVKSVCILSVVSFQCCISETHAHVSGHSPLKPYMKHTSVPPRHTHMLSLSHIPEPEGLLLLAQTYSDWKNQTSPLENRVL